VQDVEQLGKYRLIAVLARGGMGDVYLAILQGVLGFDKLLVVKELRQHSPEVLDDTAVTMFLDEAKLASRLNHPNVVHTIEAGIEGHRRFIAMEYLDGQPLSRVLHRVKKRGSRLPLAMHAKIMFDVLTALEYAHSLSEFDGKPLGIVHRDVSPQNVFVTYQGQVKLIDFGIAKTTIASQETHAGILKGKIRYMSPEQATGSAVDRRADVFAVGIMLWNTFTGFSPWEGMPENKIFEHLISGTVPRLREARPDLDPGLAALVDRATHPNPVARYPTAVALRDDLERRLAACRVSLEKARDLPGFVSALFADDRGRLQALIDKQLSIVRGHGPVQLVTLSGVRERDTSTMVRPLPNTLVPTPMDAVQGLPSEPLVWPKALRPHRRWFRAAVGAASIAAVALLLLRVGTLRMDLTAPTASDAPPVSPATLTPAPSSYRIRVETSPPVARLSIDDLVVPNPYVADKEPDGAPHVVRAEAPGYIAKTSTLRFDANTALQLALEREPSHVSDVRPASVWAVRATLPSALPPSLPPAAAPPRTPLEAPPSKPKREVDKENPYGP